jgi:hypothetical protein
MAKDTTPPKTNTTPAHPAKVHGSPPSQHPSSVNKKHGR